MSYTIQLSDEAIQDYDEAVAWYEEQKPGLGFDFSYHLALTIEQIETFPASHPLLYENRRFAVMRKFPYKVFFLFSEGQPDIIVFAILHDKRHPDFWKSRSNNP